MARMTDLDDLLEKVARIQASDGSQEKRVGEIIIAITNSPTVEVAKGRLEDEYGGKYANPRYRCSVCKEKALFKQERDVLGNFRYVQALTPFCPNCSADLRGDGDA